MKDISDKYKLMESSFGINEGLDVEKMEHNIGFHYAWLGGIVRCICGFNPNYHGWNNRK